LRYNLVVKINFYSEYDNPELEKAAKEYKEIWEKEGSRITKTIEKISGLKFEEKLINAIIYNEISYSVPLRLQADISIEHKKGALIHELCHRIVVGNNIHVKVRKTYTGWNTDIHKHIFLILHDVRIELFGEEFAKEEIDFEISLWNGKGISPYKIAWDWALAMTKEERQKLWKESLKK
jgi:hypothetical protein